MTPDALRCDYEATWFALAFLMPAEMFRADYVRFEGKVPLLAHHYQLAFAPIEMRIRDLGLDQPEYQI